MTIVSDSVPIPSVSIDGLLAARDFTIEALRQARDLVAQSNAMLERFGATGPKLVLPIAHNDNADLSDPREWDRIVADVERSIWKRLFYLTSIDTMMDHKTRTKLFEKLETPRYRCSPDDALPPLTRENIQSTFSELANKAEEFFDQCVDSVYRSLSWDHKTNEPSRIGETLIVTGAFYMWQRALQGETVNLNRTDSLHDLERVLCILDLKPAPTNVSAGLRNLGSIPYGQWIPVPNPNGGEPLMSVKCFRKGTTHVRITKREHVDAMNRIIARLYPGALPETRESKAQRKRAEPIRPDENSALGQTDQQRRGAFYTPPELAEYVAEAAFEHDHVRSVLEPSAGDGSLVRAAIRAGAKRVHAVESDPEAAQHLRMLAERVESRDVDVTVYQRDFFDLSADFLVDLVLMNPPFSNGREVEHVLNAWHFVKPGGRLVAIMSAAVQYRVDGRYGDFARFLKTHHAYVEALPKGSFAESGTDVSTVLVKIRRDA